MPFQALLPLITSGVGSIVQQRQANDANRRNALTLSDAPFTGQRTQGFTANVNLGNNILKGLAGSFQAAKGIEADRRLQNQRQTVADAANQRAALENQFLQAQLGGLTGANQANALPDASSIFALLGNGSGFGGFA